MIDIILNENELTFNRLEKEIYKAACEMACQVFSNILEVMDKKIADERDKSRYRHKGKRRTTVKTLMGETTFYRTVYEHINREYNVDEIEMRILNGDGVFWIKHGIDDTVHYQLEPFHKHQAILRNVSDRTQRKTILELLGENRIDETLEYVEALANSIEDEKEEKKLRGLYTYFNENRYGLIPYQERGLRIPPPPDGIVYRNLGTMEHHICDIIVQRMKHNITRRQEP